MSEDTFQFPRERLSLCMIVKNEEEKLARCLRSAQPWVGEMVIVDTGSTDGTVAIAESFGAKVVHFQWCDDFAAARNASLEAATLPWALVLDADEELIVEMPELLAALVMQSGALRASIRLYSVDEHASTTGAPVLRLFDRTDPTARYRARIHEHLMQPDTGDIASILLDGLRIRHDGYRAAVVTSRGKIERNIRLARLQLADAPDDPHAWWALASSVHSVDAKEAFSGYEKCRELMRAQNLGPNLLMLSTYVLGADALAELGRWDDIPAWLDEGLTVFPGHPDLLIRRGRTYLAKRDFQAAEADLLAARLANRSAEALRYSDPLLTQVFTRVGRAEALLNLGRDEEGEQELLAAVPLTSERTASPFTMLVTLKLKQGDYSSALDFAERGLESAPNSGDLRLLAAKAGLEVGRYQKVLDILEPFPNTSGVSQLRLSALLEDGRAPEACELLKEAVGAHDPFWAGLTWLCHGASERAGLVWTEAELPEEVNDATRQLVTFARFVYVGAAQTSWPSWSPDATRQLHRALRALLRNQRFDAFEQLITKTSALPAGVWWPIRRSCGAQLCLDGFTELALEMLLPAWQDEPDQPELLYWIGYCALQEGKLDDAHSLWIACLDRLPDHAPTRQGLEVLSKSGFPAASGAVAT
ncbi:MAG: glycosyltransferase [Candidatus Sericytochromatia bacterium]|nr:glycosyltransferase [Candidatus Sericytochromatia bacterium]